MCIDEWNWHHELRVIVVWNLNLISYSLIVSILELSLGITIPLDLTVGRATEPYYTLIVNQNPNS